MKPRSNDRAFESAAACICHWPDAQRGIDELRRGGVGSFSALAQRLPKLGVRLRRIALWLMAHARTRAVQAILVELLQDRRVARETAAVLSRELWYRESERTLDALGHLMQHAAENLVRLAAVEAVSTLADERIIDPLVRVACKFTEETEVRAAAIKRTISVLQYALPQSPAYRCGIAGIRQLHEARDPAVQDTLKRALLSHMRVRKHAPTKRELIELAGAHPPPSVRRVGIDPHFDTAAQRITDEAFYCHGSAAAAQRRIRALTQAGITSFGKLRAVLPGMQEELRRTGVELLGHADRRIATPVFLSLLRMPEFATEYQMWCCLSDSRSRRVYNEVLNAMVASASASARNAAIRSVPREFADEAIRPLLEVAKNPQESPLNRGDAIEQIGALAENRRTRTFRLAAKAITALLRDDAVDVRFWCCYALGVMRVKSAVPSLRRIALSDKGYYRGMRISMKEEAASAIVAIRTGRWPESAESLFSAVGD